MTSHIPPITSTHNPRFKALRALRLRKHRQREGLYLIEGIRIVEEALTGGAPVETLVYAPELLVSDRARALLDRVDADQRLAISGDLFRILSQRDEPQGIAAAIRIQEPTPADIPLRDDLLVIVAYQLRDPGNLGTIIRTADATGATAVVIVEPSVDLYDPQTVRATMGSLYALPIVHLADEGALTRWVEDLRAAGLPLLVVASSAHAAQLHYEADYRRPLVLLVGSERNGLPQSVRGSADLQVRLPMSGRATSLNVAAATAALVYEIVRQRALSRGPDSSLRS
ncbi:MAG: TrmH family RNA methyltransferase [Anaerolineae bacterium]